ncbi:hypothetical protein [Carboxylicivirga taeanensis]|uniref:hypothetical protein n=1 Tax=Carboxylicivirga taeanensis TaxID=1416875 RepID=UPI003F6DB98A
MLVRSTTSAMQPETHLLSESKEALEHAMKIIKSSLKRLVVAVSVLLPSSKGVKTIRNQSVKKEKLFERSEFFSYSGEC